MRYPQDQLTWSSKYRWKMSLGQYFFLRFWLFCVRIEAVQLMPSLQTPDWWPRSLSVILKQGWHFSPPRRSYHLLDNTHVSFSCRGVSLRISLLSPPRISSSQLTVDYSVHICKTGCLRNPSHIIIRKFPKEPTNTQAFFFTFTSPQINFLCVNL